MFYGRTGGRNTRKACVSTGFTERLKNLFYRYLSIRTQFRGELIQINRQVGFANFSNYQDRKEIFIEGQTEYENELIRLALNETMRKQNIVSLEARICPKKSSTKLYEAIKKSEKIVADGRKNILVDNNRPNNIKGDSLRCDNQKYNVTYVLPFDIYWISNFHMEEICILRRENTNTGEDMNAREGCMRLIMWERIFWISRMACGQ